MLSAIFVAGDAERDDLALKTTWNGLFRARLSRRDPMNPNGTVVASGEGPGWSMEPGRKSVVKLQNDDTEQSVMMFEETAPAGTMTRMHLHHDSDEVAYVLSGEITFKIGDQINIGGPGTTAVMPRDVPHAWKSTGAETGRVLFLYTPGRAGGLF